MDRLYMLRGGLLPTYQGRQQFVEIVERWAKNLYELHGPTIIGREIITLQDVTAMLSPFRADSSLESSLSVNYVSKSGQSVWTVLPEGTIINVVAEEHPQTFLEPITDPMGRTRLGRAMGAKDPSLGILSFFEHPWVNLSYLIEVYDDNLLLAGAADRDRYGKVTVRCRVLELLYALRPDVFEIIGESLRRLGLLQEDWYVDGMSVDFPPYDKPSANVNFWTDLLGHENIMFPLQSSNLKPFGDIVRGVWGLIRGAAALVGSWMNKGFTTILDLARSLRGKAEEMKRGSLVESVELSPADKKKISDALLQLNLPSKEVDFPTSLKAAGIGLAEVLTKGQVAGSYQDKVAEKVYLASLGLSSLAQLLKSNLPPGLPDPAIRTVGYWMLKVIAQELETNYETRLPVAAFVSGTVHRDVKILIDMGRYPLYADQRYHPDARDLRTLNLSPGMEMPMNQGSVERDFGWLVSRNKEKGYWVVTHRNVLDLVIEEQRETNAAEELKKMAHALDKRRRREVSFVFGPEAFDADSLAMRVEVREAFQVSEQYPSIIFRGFFRITNNGVAIPIQA